MRTLMLLTAACALTLGAALPLSAQTDAGTPPLTPSAPDNRSIPQKLLLPNGGDQTGAVTTDRTAYETGQPIAITFTVSNPTAKPAVYNFPTGQKFEVSVVDIKGSTVWQLSHGKKFPQALSRLSIAPGKSETFQAVWNGLDAKGKPVAPGAYMVNARMTSNSGTAITGGFLVSTDTDPNNMGIPTRTPADTGAIRQVAVMPPVSASKQVIIGAPAPPPSAKSP